MLVLAITVLAMVASAVTAVALLEASRDRQALARRGLDGFLAGVMQARVLGGVARLGFLVGIMIAGLELFARSASPGAVLELVLLTGVALLGVLSLLDMDLGRTFRND